MYNSNPWIKKFNAPNFAEIYCYLIRRGSIPQNIQPYHTFMSFRKYKFSGTLHLLILVVSKV
jgi:hypothetical protein